MQKYVKMLMKTLSSIHKIRILLKVNFFRKGIFGKINIFVKILAHGR